MVLTHLLSVFIFSMCPSPIYGEIIAQYAIGNETSEFSYNNYNNYSHNISVSLDSVVHLRFITDYPILKARCFHNKYLTDMPITKSSDTKNILLKLLVTEDAAGEWKCVFICQKENYEATDVIKLIVNIDYNMEMIIGNKFRDIYSGVADSDANYYYKSGDVINLTCQIEAKRNASLRGSLHWQYCTEAGRNCSLSSSVRSNTISHQGFRMKAENDKDYLKCVYTNGISDKYEHKVTFMLKTPEPPLITINNDTLNRKSSSLFVYGAQMGTMLSINCRNREKTGYIQWGHCSDIVSCNTIADQQTLIKQIKLDKRSVGTSVQCAYRSQEGVTITTSALLTQLPIPPTIKVSDIATHLYEADEYENISIACSSKANGTLHWDYCTNGTAGSCPSNPQEYFVISRLLVMQSKYNGTSMKCVFRDEDGFESIATLCLRLKTLLASKVKIGASSYHFQNGDTIRFACTTDSIKDVKLEIYVVDGDNKYTLDTTTRVYKSNTLISEGAMTMNAKNKQVNVECKLIKSGKKISSDSTLLTKKEPEKITESRIEADKLKQNEDQFENEKEETQSLSDLLSTNIWYLVGGAIILIVIIIAITIIVCYSRKLKSDKTKTTYENFSNESPTPPFPTRAKLEETYMTPKDNQESPYSYVQSSEISAYATPYKPTNPEYLYTKPIPKSQRQKEIPPYATVMSKNKRKQDLTYAEINVNSGKDSEKNINDKSLAPKYATVRDSTDYENNYTKPGKMAENYYNLFNNESYVNSKNLKTEYAEPNYCEINKK